MKTIGNTQKASASLGTMQSRGYYNDVYSADANKTASSDAWTNEYIKLTSSLALTATCDYVLPLTAGGRVFVFNSTTGGQSVIIKGASGTFTNTTLANGKGAWFWSDGTNYYRDTADVTP